MTESKFTSSIARQINMNFWFRQFFIFILMDMLMILLTAGVFFQWDIRKICDWDNLTILKALFLENKYLPIIVLVFQALVLFDGIFQTRKIRRVMRPLNEMAKKAQELGNIAFDPEKFSSLEDAISHIQPDSPDAMLATGDKDLKSLEVAINNLLERMRRIYRQQNQFVSDASHELRTPISVISGYGNMLKRWGKEDEEILNESVDSIIFEAENMKNLVNRLLFLAKYDKKNLNYKFEKTNLSETIGIVIKDLSVTHPDITILHTIDDNVYIMADEFRIIEVVRIFVDNAIKYSNKDDITLKIILQKQENNAILTIKDNGMGIKDEDLRNVFDRFYRTDKSRNKETGGMGLGLSIAKAIVLDHKGRIRVKTKENEGSEFSIILPLLK